MQQGRQRLIAGLIAICLGAGGCSQSSINVPAYQYEGTEKGAGSLGIHTMRAGDTLWSVAKAYQVDLRELLDLNDMVAPYRISIGQRLQIPAPKTYRTRTGDTLYKISRVFETSTFQLARLNRLQAPFVLKEGQVLKLPSEYGDHQKQEVALSPPSPPPLPVSVLSKPRQKSGHKEIEREELLAARPVPVFYEPENKKKLPDNLSGTGFIKPVSGKIISSFGPKRDGFHNDGINIRAARGDAVMASEQGIVVYTGSQIEGYGNMILVRHSGGFLTAYAHLDKTLVRKGDRVSRGQTIGTVGTSGSVSSPQLHFEVRNGRNAVDPARFIRA